MAGTASGDASDTSLGDPAPTVIDLTEASPVVSMPLFRSNLILTDFVAGSWDWLRLPCLVSHAMFVALISVGISGYRLRSHACRLVS